MTDEQKDRISSATDEFERTHGELIAISLPLPDKIANNLHSVATRYFNTDGQTLAEKSIEGIAYPKRFHAWVVKSLAASAAKDKIEHDQEWKGTYNGYVVEVRARVVKIVERQFNRTISVSATQYLSGMYGGTHIKKIHATYGPAP